MAVHRLRRDYLFNLLGLLRCLLGSASLLLLHASLRLLAAARGRLLASVPGLPLLLQGLLDLMQVVVFVHGKVHYVLCRTKCKCIKHMA